MNKQLSAVITLAAVSIPAMFIPVYAADSPLTIYGIMNVTYSYANNGAYAANNTIKQSTVETGNTKSRLGFKGEEALDGNLHAFFLLETALSPDDGNSGLFGSREAWVGLRGDFGKIGLGRGKTPYTNLADIFDINAGVNDLEMYTEKNGMTGFNSSRFNNAIRYDTPAFGAFSGAIMYGAGENKTAASAAAPGATAPGVDATQSWSAALRYKEGPLLVGLAFNSARNVGTVPVDGANNHAYLLSSTYKVLDNFTLGASFQNAVIDSNATKKDRNYADFIAIYSIGKLDLRGGALWGGKIKWTSKKTVDGAVTNDVDGSDTLRYTLGAQYNFSKRTGVYIEYNGDNFDKDATATAVAYNAAKHAAITTTNKADASFFNIGVIHRF